MTQVILIVDDDPLIRKLIATTLQDVGSRLLEAGDGLEALEAAAEERPAIVFLDYDMPRLDGIETCRRLRADPATADATIIMLTAMADREAQVSALQAGADLFVSKPFSPLRLLRLVDDLAAGRC